MNWEQWSAFFQISSIVSGIVTAVAAGGTWYTTKMADKEAAIENEHHRKNLEDGIANLQRQVEPFADLAKSRFPGINQQDALKKLQDEIERNEQRVRSLEARTAPRIISSDDAAKLTNVLRHGAGNKIALHAPIGDTEAFDYAKSLQSIFAAAGWTVLRDITMRATRTNQIIVVVAKDPPPAPAQLIYQAFQAIGKTVVAENSQGSEVTGDDVILIVGSK